MQREFKIKILPTHLKLVGNSKLIKEIATQNSVPFKENSCKLPVTDISHAMFLVREFSVKSMSYKGNSLKIKIDSLKNENTIQHITIYTDGSCRPTNPGTGGWGFVAMYDNKTFESFGGQKNSTNNIMELTAVLEALKKFPNCKKYTIFSDSQYVVNTLQGKWKRNKNIDLLKEIDRHVAGKNIEWVWIERAKNSHADMLSKKGNEILL